MKRTLENCGLIKNIESQPVQHDGKCEGFVGNTNETCTQCQECKLYYLYDETHNEILWLEYKGFITNPHIYFKNNCIYGKIENITDLVNFEAETPKDFIKEFHLAVDDYLEFRKEVEK